MSNNLSINFENKNSYLKPPKAFSWASDSVTSKRSIFIEPPKTKGFYVPFDDSKYKNKPAKIVGPKVVLKPELAVKEAEKLLSTHPNTANGGSLKISQGRLEGWCADTVNEIYANAYGKNPFGATKTGEYKLTTVQSLMDWGIQKNIFHKANDKKDIQKQIKQIKPGDIIIWKSPFVVKVAGCGNVTRHASHTGIVKEIKNGKIYTIEGNANVYKKNKKGELLLVKNEKEGINGSQAIGDFQEVNRYDGVISKSYSVIGLLQSGYSGFIDMQNVKP